MSARITIVAGPARCGKTQRLLSAYRAELAEQPRHADRLTSTLWLAPNRRAVERVRLQLLDGELPGCFGPGVRTFDQFAADVLLHADDEIRPIDVRMKRMIVEELIREAAAAGRLRHFAAIADTPGFLDLTCEFISELKRVEIWPEDFERACAERSQQFGGEGVLSLKDRELADVYRRYQQRLLDERLYDAEGRFWSARELLCRGQQAPLEGLRLVIVDGFTDFSRTQHEMLEELARRCESMLISLVDEADGGRDDLFSKPRRTLGQLQSRHPQLVVERPTRRDGALPPLLQHVERELFKNPRNARPATSSLGIEVVAAAGAVNEVETAARRIKKLLVDGDEGRPVRPDDVAVVFRSADGMAALVREIFSRYGLPIAVEAGRRLDQSPALTALAALLQLDADDWPFRGLLAVVGSNYFRPAWSEWLPLSAAPAVERTIRRMQIAAGREPLLEAVARLAESPLRAVETTDPDGDSAERHNAARADAVAALPVLRRLAEAFTALPSRASSGGWAAALEELANETGLWRSLHEVEEHRLVLNDLGSLSADRAAWAKFRKSLASGDELAWLGSRASAELDRAQLLDLVNDVIRTEQLPGDHDEVGRIRVLSATTARSISVPYLYILGLNENSFPAGEPQGRLYAESDYQQLSRVGLPLPVATDRRGDEMLLFYETLTRAERMLWLSYPALNEKAEPLLASPYLEELRRVCGVKLQETKVDDLTPIPPADAVLNGFDAPIRAAATARESADISELAAVLCHGGASADNLAAALLVVDARSHGGGFGPYEGIIAGDVARQAITRRFGPEYPFSASRLEQYGRCPFQFFVERVLRLQPCDDVGLEIDRRRRGSRLHRLLAELHGELNDLGTGHTPATVAPDDYAEMVRRLAASDAAEDEDHPLAAAMAEIDRRLLHRWMDDYVEQHRKYEAIYKQSDEQVRPRHFEASFGLPRPADDRVSTTEPLRVVLDDEQVLVTGRIDRLDIGIVAGRAVFTVIDYKTGGAHGKQTGDVVSGRALQLTLYAVAAQDLLLKEKPTEPWQCGYWFLADGGFKKTLTLYKFDGSDVAVAEPWPALKAQLQAHVVSLVRGIRRGEFPMFNLDEQCTSICDFRTICRVGQTRSLEKRWQPPQARRS